MNILPNDFDAVARCSDCGKKLKLQQTKRTRHVLLNEAYFCVLMDLLFLDYKNENSPKF